jgi:hypothetical protein
VRKGRWGRLMEKSTDVNYLGEKIYHNFRRPRMEDPVHLKFIRTLPSCISGRSPCVAHHLLNVPGRRGVAMKADDMWAIPLTAEEHDQLHRECASKTEDAWFAKYGVESHSLALFLWHNTGKHGICEAKILRTKQ